MNTASKLKGTVAMTISKSSAFKDHENCPIKAEYVVLENLCHNQKKLISELRKKLKIAKNAQPDPTMSLCVNMIGAHFVARARACDEEVLPLVINFLSDHSRNHPQERPIVSDLYWELDDLECWQKIKSNVLKKSSAPNMQTIEQEAERPFLKLVRIVAASSGGWIREQVVLIKQALTAFKPRQDVHEVQHD